MPEACQSHGDVRLRSAYVHVELAALKQQLATGRRKAEQQLAEARDQIKTLKGML